MKLKIALGLSATVFAFTAASAWAQSAQSVDPTATPHIDQREQRQENRIQQGEQSGSLTDKESARLEKGQAHVDRLESKAAADGSVSHKERKRLRHAERVQSRHIARAKHN